MIDAAHSTPAAPDEILSMLVESVDGRMSHRPAIPLTLLVGGTVISGGLIPAWEWMDEMGARPDAEEPNVFHRRRDEMLADNRIIQHALSKEFELSEAERSMLERTPTHLHLRDARVSATTSDLPPLLWRVRLTDVNAWYEGPVPAADQSADEPAA